MKRLFLLPLLLLGILQPALADGGMWMMHQLEKKMPRMQELGLSLEATDIYNPNGPSMKDAVLLFDGGCTGVLVSDQGLLLTNHHCGYDEIQKHSSVEHNYLQDGFWSQSLGEELVCPGLEVEIIDRIEEVTKQVKALLQKKKDLQPMDFLSPRFLSSLAPEIVGRKEAKRPGMKYEIKAFYGGNKYFLFVKKVFRDVRLVATPPSNIGKFGADSDNWMWPRHTGDFSIFRVYSDSEGNPVEYSPDNRPYRPRKWMQVTARGIEEGDFAMIMGYPGTTYHYFTAKQVDEWSKIDNNIRIEMRGIRQEVMLAEMLADERINIMYAAKYASSQNGYKRAQGANWAIRQRDLEATKLGQQRDLLARSSAQGDNTAQQAVDRIAHAIDARHDLRYRQRYLLEGILDGIEFSSAPYANKELIETWGDKTKREKNITTLQRRFAAYYNKDYSPEVDRKIAKAILKRYCQRIDQAYWPAAIREGVKRFNGVDDYVDFIFDRSIFRSPETFAQFMKEPDLKKLQQDPMGQFAQSALEEYHALQRMLVQYDAPIATAQQDYIAAMMKYPPVNETLWSDANLTLRFTFGQVKGYKPRDVVSFGAKSTLEGVMEKEDPDNWEYVVAPRLKEIYRTKDFGPYANKDGSMPVNFCATTHTTGGNSGSPVFNSRGEVIGLNFDRNWEGVGGDIEYLPGYQRSIILDMRYLLLVVDKLGNCQRLIKEMNPTH